MTEQDVQDRLGEHGRARVDGGPARGGAMEAAYGDDGSSRIHTRTRT